MTDVTALELCVLGSDQAVPYDLLLLADESVESIDRYVHDCTVFTMLDEGRAIAACAAGRQSVFSFWSG